MPLYSIYVKKYIKLYRLYAETEDTTIADISVAIGAELIKTGAPARSERNAKYSHGIPRTMYEACI